VQKQQFCARHYEFNSYIFPYYRYLRQSFTLFICKSIVVKHIFPGSSDSFPSNLRAVESTFWFSTGVEAVFAVTVLPGDRNLAVIGSDPERDRAQSVG